MYGRAFRGPSMDIRGKFSLETILGIRRNEREMTTTAKISPFLWFDNQAEEAANFYVSIFPNSAITNITKIPAGPAEGNPIVEFQLDGQKFTAIDGGPIFEFTPAISLVVSCDSQEKIDYFSDNLSQGGGKQDVCGWIHDKFGVSWQVQPAPEITRELMERAPKAVMEAMLSMTKIDIARLRQAAGSA